jgi:methyl-accepting chemotaxis protein
MATDDVLKSLVETLHIYRESHDKKFDRLGDKIEDLAGQVSHLTTTVERMSVSIDTMSLSVDRMAHAIDRMAHAIDGNLQVSQQQAMNISELTKLVASQSNTVNRLIDRVAAIS